MKRIVFMFLCVQLLIGLSQAQEMNSMDFKSEALKAGRSTITIFRDFLNTLDQKTLLDGVREASKTNTLMEIWLSSSPNMENAERVDMMVMAFGRLCGDLGIGLLDTGSLNSRDIMAMTTFLNFVEEDLDKM